MDIEDAPSLVERDGSTRTRKRRPLMTFFLLIFVLSVPIWILGAVAADSLPEGVPMDLPISSLAVFCPTIAAVIVVGRESG